MHRAGRSPRRRGTELLAAGLSASVALGVCLLAAGSAAAAGPVFCTDSNSDQALVQTAINGGGTVVVHGHCLGNWTVANDVTLTGIGGAALDGGAAGSVLTVNTLTIVNGKSDIGGGIDAAADSSVAVNNSTITGNVATELGIFGLGGGIYEENGALVTLTGTTVADNTADESGGIFAGGAFLVATGSSISHNAATDEAAGGIGAEFSDIALTNTHVSGNTAPDAGGGIDYFSGGTGGPLPPSIPGPGLTLTRSTVDHNSAREGAGMLNEAFDQDSPVTLVSSTISANNGGGVWNEGAAGTTASFTALGSTITGNAAPFSEGGAIFNTNNDDDGTALVTLSRTSVTANRAALGGGIFNDERFGIADVTLQSGTAVMHNQATETGGGICNNGGSLTVGPGALVILNVPNNIVADCTGE